MLHFPYFDYAFRALMVVAFWWFMARKRLFGAAMLQIIGFPIMGSYLIPVIPGVFALQMGYAFALVLLVEVFRQGIHKRIMGKSRSATFVKLLLALFAVCVASYLIKGADEFSDPVGALLGRFAGVTLPVVILALAWQREELWQLWRVGLMVSMVTTMVYFIASVSGISSGVSGIDLRNITVLQYGLVGGAYTALWLLVLSACAPAFSKWQAAMNGVLLGMALILGPLLTVMSSNRTLTFLFPIVVALMLIFCWRRRTLNNISGVMLGIAVMMLVSVLMLLVRPDLPGKVTEAYDVLLDRFRGEYGAEEGSGRYEMWRQAWQLFLKEPILGGGEANSGILSTTFIETENESHTFRISTHGAYLKYLGEQGVLGGGLLFVIICSFFANAAHVLRRSFRDNSVLVVGRGACVLGLAGLAFAVPADETLFVCGAALVVACLTIDERMAAFRRHSS